MKRSDITSLPTYRCLICAHELGSGKVNFDEIHWDILVELTEERMVFCEAHLEQYLRWFKGYVEILRDDQKKRAELLKVFKEEVPLLRKVILERIQYNDKLLRGLDDLDNDIRRHI
ncbi:MAG: hypothetical protein ACE5K4_08680 [Candidatus Hydrothermarchaeota archaeon]